MSRLSNLLLQVESTDPQLAADLRREVEALSGRRAFGLNFERHIPETVELPGRPIRKGDKVRFLPERGKPPSSVDGRLWRVAAIDRTKEGSVAQLFRKGDAEGEAEAATRACDDLVVVAEFRDPIYPGLVSTGKIERGGDKPFHTVINAENFHALQALLYTHEGKVDAIYVDPPYNTGSEGWIYNDRYVTEDDVYRHSKWLAFIERRLILARRLLKPTGVIVVAIGDEEHHRLRMLMDQILGNQNFIANVVWQGAIKNDARFNGGGQDYMLFYGRNLSTMLAAGARWRTPKEGLQDVLDAGAQAWQESGNDHAEASRLLSSWWRANKRHYDPGLGDNVKVDRDGTVIKVSDLSWPGGGGPKYDVLHPETGRPVRVPSRGWIYPDPATMQAEIEAGRVLFGKDHKASARRKRPLVEMDTQPARPTFYKDRRAASQYLRKVLGEARFPFPKDHEILMRWLAMLAPPDALVLDFFGGSGTTSEAVMRLNANDGGSRQSILITNNELSVQDAKALRREGFRPGDPEWDDRGVCRFVTEPRIATVATGVRPDGSEFSDGLEANVEFFTMTYEAPRPVAHNRSFQVIAPLLWLKAGSRGRRIEMTEDGFEVADTYGVLFDLDSSKEFLEAITSAESVRVAFIVTDDDRGFQAVCGELPGRVESVRLYESYLTNFTINTGRE